MVKQKSCEERIDEHLQGRVEEIKEVLNQYGEDEKIKFDGCEYEDVIEWLNCWALAYEDDPHYRAKRLELSTGGPADGFIFFEDGSIKYYFQDWFDGAERELYGEDEAVLQDLYEYALNF
jgi:hypothetical protein